MKKKTNFVLCSILFSSVPNTVSERIIKIKYKYNSKAVWFMFNAETSNWFLLVFSY